MRKQLRLVVLAAMGIGGMMLVGCQNGDHASDNTRATSNGGMTGGGSTDVYGNTPNDRYRQMGNIGTGVGSGAGTPLPASGNSNGAGNGVNNDTGTGTSNSNGTVGNSTGNGSNGGGANRSGQ